MATAKNIPPILAKSLDPVLLDWLRSEIREAINNTDSEKANRASGVTIGNIASLRENGDPEDSGYAVGSFAAVDHTHNLEDLTEKSYTSLEDVPVAATADDGPGDASPASAVSSISVASGADTVDRTDLNSDLSALVIEINAIKDVLNNLVSSHNALKLAHNDIIDELQAVGLMET